MRYPIYFTHAEINEEEFDVFLLSTCAIKYINIKKCVKPQQ